VHSARALCGTEPDLFDQQGHVYSELPRRLDLSAGRWISAIAHGTGEGVTGQFAQGMRNASILLPGEST
jgi:hypothetical protein